MKRILSITAILGLAFLFTSAITILDVPQDPPKSKKETKHIKMVKVKDGEKVELDTIIEGDNVFVWHGDTIGGGKELKWISKEDFNLDSLHENFEMDFDIDIEKGEDGNVFIMKSGKGDKAMIKEFMMNGDSKFNVIKKGDGGDHDVMFWSSDEGNNEMIFHAPKVAGVPHAPEMMFFGKGKKANVIDLSDEGIISFKKKKMSGGRERITIIRNEVKEEEKEIHEEITLHGNGDHPMMWQGKPGENKSVKITKKEGGLVEVFEDENVWTTKEGDSNVRVIEEDGKIIRIKEIKEGGQKKVEVKVEVKEEAENEK